MTAPPRAVLLDGLGTLLDLEPPAPLLRAAVRERFGVDVGEADAERAMAAEIAYYRAHHLEGRNAEALAALRHHCARVLRDALPPLAAAPVEEVREALLAALRFRPFADVKPALHELRAAGLRLVAVSNWDVSLHERLSDAGLGPLLDGAVTSAEAGAPKPDARVFERALALAGAPPAAAVHVGDGLAEDVEGARAAGIDALLLLRGEGRPPPAVRAIRSLAELPGALTARS